MALQLHKTVNPDDPIVADFRNCLYICFKHLRPNSDVTPAQYEIAEFLQHGWELYGEDCSESHGRLDLIEAFRGIGKSEILACYTLWLLKRNPEEEKVLVLSATAAKAKKFVHQTKEILLRCPIFYHLRPKTYQRDAFDLFDVAGASNTQSPSVQAQSITGQITGDRASTIIADDIEVWENSRTEERRKELADRTLEFSNIIYPPSLDREYKGGDIIFLGTPQSEESIYSVLVKERNYRAWIWPARYPDLIAAANYIVQTSEGRMLDTLAPPIREKIGTDSACLNNPTDTRFDNDTLLKRAAQGKLNWELQYMLNTTISDEARYPLKQRDCMVFPTNPQRAPRIVQWGRDTDKRNYVRDIPNWGFSGDFWLMPLFRSEDDDWSNYDLKIAWVDTSGRGHDETSWCIIGVLNGTFWLLHLNGMSGVEARELMLKKQANATPGFIPTDSYDLRMEKIAKDCKAFGVSKIYIETNFGDGLWTKAFQPILAKIWPAKHAKDESGCACEEIRAFTQKEQRICDTLEPILLNHRLVINDQIARDDGEFGYQLTHITRERGALRRDDRIDAVASGLAALSDTLAQDQIQAAASSRDELQMREFNLWLERMHNPTFRPGLRPSRKGLIFDCSEDIDDYEESSTTSCDII